MITNRRIDLMKRRATLRIGRRTSYGHFCAAVCLAASALGGCSSAPPVTQTGFLSDYSRLSPAGENRMRYQSASIVEYSSFIVDPVQFRSESGGLSREQRAEVAGYFHDTLTQTLRNRGYTVTDSSGTATARIRVAITNINDSTWWKKIHPASSLAGAGRGGASMEGEIIDSVSGKQLAAVVQAAVGSQFTIANFDTVSDIKNVIDRWVMAACDRLDELRAGVR
jgi:hypothetical protein